MEDYKLIQFAQKAMKNSYSPYSKFKVGSALLTQNGEVYTGCNIENASYPVCNCAERTALFSAVNEGNREFLKIAVVGSKTEKITDFTPPCGMCRQALSEFCNGDFEILLYNGDEIKKYKLSELLPESFGKEKMCKD